MKQITDLNGSWELFYFEDEPTVTDVNQIPQICHNKITATVPGNFEVSLFEAGVITKDLYKGMATEENQIYEDYDWWYRTEFAAPSVPADKELFLSFGAVDCIAEYFINGEKVYESDNAFIEQRFNVTDKVVQGGNNVLYVHIKSAMKYVFEQEYNQYLAHCSRDGYQAYLRKPVHSFGWDIFPRAVTGGIWKDVALELCPKFHISDFSYHVADLKPDKAILDFGVVMNGNYADFKKDIAVKVTGVCKDSTFTYTHKVNHCRLCNFSVEIKNPLLWWPYGYGDANIYDLTYELYLDGIVTDSRTMNLGIRTIKLDMTDTMLDANHRFNFVVNGVNIMCKGSNWVPLDAYHSKDKAKYPRAMELFTDTHCNILRVWGGGVYEQDEFYDYCDRHGIMIWHDFCMACCSPSLDEKTLANIKKEATWVIKTLRHHPAIILWSGDNELDENHAIHGKHSDMNKVSRQIIPDAIDQNDSGRPYLPSSPYLTDKISRNYIKEFCPEADIYPQRHLWGSRDYFKAPFYSQSRAHFVSETGYHGCPSAESVRKIVDKDKVWPIYNDQWILHSSDQVGNPYRVKLMEDQIMQLFAFKPDNIEDFAMASQISQAEAKKYFIERIRIKKPYTSGVIWWNMLDGWPQMSDAVVDYFFDKKLAYYYIKQSQQPVVLMLDEMHDWNHTIVVSNDTLKDVEGTYKVYEADTKKVLAEGSFGADANSNRNIGNVRLMYSDQKYLIIEWKIDGKTYYNHYLSGYPAFDFAQYKNWLDEYKKLW